MEAYLFECTKSDKLDRFISEYAINQQDYHLSCAYNKLNGFNYKYIVCEDLGDIVGVMPFILYKNLHGNIIQSMPFLGYGGISSVKDNICKIYECIIKFLLIFCRDHEVLLTTICTVPFNNNYSIYKDIFKPDFENKNFYQFMHIGDDTFTRLNSKFRGNLRRNIKKCKEYGVELVESYSEEDLVKWYSDVYKKRLIETNCAIYPFEIFQLLVNKLNKSRVKMIYAKLNNKIIGGGLFLNQGRSLDNFMRVVDSEYFYTQAGTMIDHWSIEYAKENNIEFYNWQSCDNIGSSIYNYKEDWGSEVDYHYYLTKITGDISKLKQIPLDTIKEQYKGIYVMPYSEFINNK